MDGTRLTTYPQWRFEANYDACMQSPDWNAAAGVKLQSMIDYSRAHLDVYVYEVIWTAGA
jgi:hypothetical protein